MELDGSERELFVAEVSEKIQELGKVLIRFEQDTANTETLNLLFRIAHTIKGNASFVDLTAMIEVAHALEDGFAALRDQGARADAPLVQLFYQASDTISDILEKYKAGASTENAAYEVLARQIRAALEGQGNPAAAAKPEVTPTAKKSPVRVTVSPGEFIYQIEIKLSDSTPMAGMRAYLMRKKLTSIAKILKEKPEAGGYEDKAFSGLFGFIAQSKASAPDIRKTLLNAETEHLVVKRLQIGGNPTAAAPAPATPASTPATKAESTPKDTPPIAPQANAPAAETGELLRVPIRKIDDLINLVGELLSNNSVYAQINQDLRRMAGSQGLYAQYRDNAEEMARIVGELQEKVLKVRMIPIDSIFSRFARVVRDYNSKHPDKTVRLQIVGGETEIDKGQIENLYEPLLHMVRNSIDHGVETKAQRVASGKNPEGLIVLSASQEGNNVYIEIRDDGAGLNEKKIRDKAIERKLLTPEEAESLKKNEIFSYIYMPGFSTAASVTDISGRGVGMDVVKRSIDELHGRITVESESGKGSVFRIALPLSLAIVTALRIQVRASSMAIPITSIAETIKIKKSEIFTLENIEAVDVRGKHIPVLSLARELSVAGFERSNEDSEHVVIVHVRQGVVGLRVDQLFGYEDMVIKSLAKNFEDVEGVSGAAILGRGNICLILDPQKLVDAVYARGTGMGPAGPDPMVRPRVSIERGDSVMKDSSLDLLEKILESGQKSALAAIRQMTGNAHITLEYRQVRIQTWEIIARELGTNQFPDEKIFYTGFESRIDGLQFIRIGTGQMNMLATLVYGEHSPGETEVESAITELVNIISVSFTNAVTLHTGIRVYPTVPHRAIDAKDLLNVTAANADRSSDALTMNVQFQTELRESLFSYSIVLPRSVVREFSPQARDY